MAAPLLGCGDQSQERMAFEEPSESAQLEQPEGALDPAVQAVIETRLKAVQRNPSTSNAYRSLGLAYEANGAWVRAIDAFRKTLELDPTDHATRLHLGACLALAGGDREALEQLEIVVKAMPNGAAGLYRLGVGYLKVGRFQEARRHFLTVRNLLPSNPHGHLGLGQVELEEGNPQAALEHLEKARTTGKGNEFVDFALGQCLADLGRDGEAMPLLSQGADAARPTLADSLSREMGRYGVSRAALLSRASNLHQAGDPAGAKSILEQLQKGYPRDLVVLNNLAAAYMAINRQDDALLTLDLVLEINPEQHSAWFNVSSIHFDRAMIARAESPEAARNHLIKALAAADKAVRHGGHLARMHTMRGKVLMIMNSHSEAVAELGEAIRLGTMNEDVYLNSSQLLIAMKRNTEAFELLLGAMQKHPDWAEVRFRCMPFFMSTKDAINARRLLAELVLLVPDDKRIENLRNLLNQRGL